MSPEQCQFRTTKPKGALSQAARRGAPTRYERCKNKAKHTIVITDVSLSWTKEREVQCCGLHKRLHEERGFMP